MLKRLQAKVETGLVFRDYSTALADTWADVKPLLENPDPSANPRLTECLTTTIDYYKAASDAWNRVIAPQDYDLEATEAGRRLEWHKLLRKHKNEWIRLFSWAMADATIEKAQAVMMGDAAKEAQKQSQIEKLQADMKRELDKINQKYSEY